MFIKQSAQKRKITTKIGILWDTRWLHMYWTPIGMLVALQSGAYGVRMLATGSGGKLLEGEKEKRKMVQTLQALQG